MSRFPHHASGRTAEIESEFAHARYIVVPALLFALAILMIAAFEVVQGSSEPAPALTVSPELDSTVPYGA